MINGTLFIQALNFFIAYIALKKILFEPGLKLLQKRAKKRAKLNREIVSLQESIAAEESDSTQRWRNFSKKIGSKKPCVLITSLRDERRSGAERQRIIDPQEEMKLVGAVKKIILNTIIQE